MTGEQMGITCNKLCAISSRLGHGMGKMVPKNGYVQLVFKQCSG